MTAKTLPPRSRVKPEDQWDLSSLFADDRAWDAAFVKWERRIAGYARFQGALAESPKQLAACLKFDLDMDRVAERLSNYAFLKTAEDTANSIYQRMLGRYRSAASRAGQAGSFIRP
ncbi:MAG TPA: oligoendopeptidase F, partial [Pirellulales bacterium]